MQKKVTELILKDLKDNESKFEVAATVNADTRVWALRWWLKMAKKIPMSEVDYDKADILYLVSPKDRLPQDDTVWEVFTLRPFKIIFQKSLGNDLIFYKLAKITNF